MAIDRSNGYEAVAERFIAARLGSRVGVATVRAWAQGLPHGAAILELGCGSGVPISEALIAEGFSVHGVDASPSMTAAFAGRFPEARVTCETVEESAFFGRAFDAAVAWGLIFLLPAESQLALIRRIGLALNSKGQLLFTAPAQVCSWNDAMTGRESRSLGADAYEAALLAAGLILVGRHNDEGDNHYYAAARRGNGSG